MAAQAGRSGAPADADEPPVGIEVKRFRAPFVEVGYRKAPPRGDSLRLSIVEKSPRERLLAVIVVVATAAAAVAAIGGIPAAYLLLIVGVPVSFSVIITHFGRRVLHARDGHLMIAGDGFTGPAPTTIDLGEVVSVDVTPSLAVIAHMTDGRSVTLIAPAPSAAHARYIAEAILAEADLAKGPRAW